MSASEQHNDVITEVRGQLGMVTLNRPNALNALSLGMVRTLTQTLQTWRDDPAVLAVTVRGAGKDGEIFGSFCAGGDLRFFHKSAVVGDTALEDFFTEEYTLNHLIATYPKPCIAFMDGVVMGGGVGIGQGASLRVVTDRTKMAMPEIGIGLFPGAGGSYFLSRCPGHAGEYLALTGQTIASPDAIAWGLADGHIDAVQLPVLWETLAATPFESANAVEHWVQSRFAARVVVRKHPLIDKIFGLPSVPEILAALDAETSSDWACDTAALLRKRSPLMLQVVLAQIRRGRSMGLTDCLRMERVMIYRSFHLRPGAASDTVEGIRAFAIDKGQQPKWNPARSEDVTPAMVAAFFEIPWTADTHPLRALG
jgi:enoyl-CoA hydratase/carnithine racemase